MVSVQEANKMCCRSLALALRHCVGSAGCVETSIKSGQEPVAQDMLAHIIGGVSEWDIHT